MYNNNYYLRLNLRRGIKLLKNSLSVLMCSHSLNKNRRKRYEESSLVIHYIYLYIHVYIYIYTVITYMYTHVHVYIYTCMYKTRTCIHTCIRTCIYTCIYIYMYKICNLKEFIKQYFLCRLCLEDRLCVQASSPERLHL